MSNLTIVIPVYNQITLCRECLSSLVSQTYQDFVVVLVDDGSVEDYRALMQEFPTLQIEYQRNERNLGAIRNIFHTIFYPVQTEYVMSMHEDDLLHPEYLQYAVQALDAHPTAVFAGSNAQFFDNASERSLRRTAYHAPPIPQECDAVDMVRFLLTGNPYMLSSIIYRTSVLQSATQPDLVKFSTACDRPFLIDLIGTRTCLAFSEPLFFSRRHGKKDMRGKDLDWYQVFALYEYYRTKLNASQNDSDRILFLTAATNDLLLTYRNFFPAMRPGRVEYIRTGYRRGLIRFSYMRMKGLFGLLAMVLGTHISFYVFRMIRKIRA